MNSVFSSLGLYQLTGIFCRTIIFMFVVGIVLFICRFAWSGERTYASLHYTRESGASACPTAQELKNAVAVQLGYVPWQDTASLAINITIYSQRNALISKIVLRDENNEILGERHLRSNVNDCIELGESTVLAVGMIIDPLARMEPSDTAESLSVYEKGEEKVDVDSSDENASSSLHSADDTSLQDNSSPSKTGSHWSLTTAVGALATWRSAPDTTAGIQLFNYFQKGHFSFGIGGRYDFSASTDLHPGTLRTFSAVGQVSACAHYWYVIGCSMVSVGALVADTEDIFNESHAVQPTVSVSARLSGVVFIGERFRIYPYTDFSVMVVRNEFIETTGGDMLWKTPPFHMTLGILAGIILFK